MLKRSFNILVSLIALLVTLPITVLIAFLIRLDSSGPVFFVQDRVGFRGRIFKLYKFRTMLEGADRMGPCITAKGDPRITQIGHILRWLKLDELPQFINVLRGDMNWVGPRPEVPEIVERYTEDERRVLDVKPGIFGPSQMSHRDEAEMLADIKDVETFYRETILPAKLKRDLAYVRNQAKFKDAKFFFAGVFSSLLSGIKLSYVFESRRRIFFLSFDLCVSLFAYWAAFMLRFDGRVGEPESGLLLAMLPMVACLRAPCFIYFGLYQTLWKYLGIQELISIVRAVTVGSILLAFVSFFMGFHFHPRSVFVMDWLMLVIALSGLRVFFKTVVDRLTKAERTGRKNVLIIGAEDIGELLVREFLKQPELGYRPVGLIDNDPKKLGVRIHGIQVLGTVNQLHRIARAKRAEEVIIALSKASAGEIEQIVKNCRESRLRCLIVPEMSFLLPAQILPLKLGSIHDDMTDTGENLESVSERKQGS